MVVLLEAVSEENALAKTGEKLGESLRSFPFKGLKTEGRVKGEELAQMVPVSRNRVLSFPLQKGLAPPHHFTGHHLPLAEFVERCLPSLVLSTVAEHSLLRLMNDQPSHYEFSQFSLLLFPLCLFRFFLSYSVPLS